MKPLNCEWNLHESGNLGKVVKEIQDRVESGEQVVVHLNDKELNNDHRIADAIIKKNSQDDGL